MPPFVMMVLYGAVILFGIGYIGNLLSFSSRFVNALVTAIVFAAIYGALIYFADPAALSAQGVSLTQQQWIQYVGFAAVLVFFIDLVANMISFENRFVNALMTAIVFAVLFGGLMYVSGGAIQQPA